MCDPEKITNREIHEIGLSWKVGDDETLLTIQWFQMKKNLNIFYQTINIRTCKIYCGDHQPCIYDLFEQFASCTRRDFSQQCLNFVHMGDKL